MWGKRLGLVGATVGCVLAGILLNVWHEVAYWSQFASSYLIGDGVLLTIGGCLGFLIGRAVDVWRSKSRGAGGTLGCGLVGMLVGSGVGFEAVRRISESQSYRAITSSPGGAGPLPGGEFIAATIVGLPVGAVVGCMLGMAVSRRLRKKSQHRDSKT